MIDVKQATSLNTSIGSYLIGDLIPAASQSTITFYLQNVAFMVSIIAGVITICYTIKKLKFKK